MAWDYDEDELLDLIAELEYADADGWLACALLELAVDYLSQNGEIHTEVGMALADAVRTLHHTARAMTAEAERQGSELAELIELSQRNRGHIRSAIEALSRSWPSSPSQRAARELAMAACLTALDSVGPAVNHVEAAVEAGATDPVAYLALGCLRYRQALQQFAPVDKLDDRKMLRFQLACLRAVSALEQGLGGDIDVHLHWWIAIALEAAGFTKAAAEAWRRYSEAADQEDAEAGEELAEDVEADIPPEPLPQISADEERQVSEALKDPRSIKRLLDGSEEADGPPEEE